MRLDYRVRRLLEHMVGPTGSLILHILLVYALMRLLIFSTAERTPEVEVVVVEPEAVELEELEQELEQIEELPELPEDVPAPETPVAPEESLEVEQMTPMEEITDFSALDIRSEVQSPLVMKGLFAGRSASGRAAMLGRYGGGWGKYTEQSVIKALEWLKKHQNADGSWGPPNKTAMTGLALLTFLAHGETTSSDRYGETVEKAIKYLVARQDAEGRFCKTDNQSGPYAHAIATYAISEAYGLTRIPALKPVMERAVQVILDGQQAGGGWNYKYDRGPRRDTSVAGWQVQALKAAYLAGADNKGLKAAMEKAVGDIKSVWNPETGRFGYTDKSWGTDGVCAVGILCLQFLGHGKDPEVRAAIQALKGTKSDWKDPGSWAMYGWYYISQAKFHYGGSTWNAWNSRIARTLTRNQNPDGSWTAPGEAAGVKDGKETHLGPVYSTTLGALTLQVYYRFLPTYQPIAVEPVDETDTDDVEVEVI